MLHYFVMLWTKVLHESPFLSRLPCSCDSEDVAASPRTWWSLQGLCSCKDQIPSRVLFLQIWWNCNRKTQEKKKRSLRLPCRTSTGNDSSWVSDCGWILCCWATCCWVPMTWGAQESKSMLSSKQIQPTGLQAAWNDFMWQFCSLCRCKVGRRGLCIISEGRGVQLSRAAYRGFIGNYIHRLLSKSRRVLGTSGWSWPSQMSSHMFVHLPGKESLQSQSKKGVLPMASRSCKRELRSHWGPWTAQVCELNTLKFRNIDASRWTQDYASTKLLPNDFGTSHRISSLPGHELCPRGDRQSNKLRQKPCFIALGGNGGMHGEPYLRELISVLEMVHFMEPKKKHGWQNGKLEGTQETFGRALPKLTSKTCLVRSVHPDNRKIWDIWCMSTFSAEVLYNYSIGDLVGECRKLCISGTGKAGKTLSFKKKVS